MTKKIIKQTSEHWWNYQEVIDTQPTEYIEENVYVDEIFLKNKALIRIDMNIIQFPIFSKNTRRKVNQVVKYFFNKNKDTYITVSPKAGDYIPGEGEEKTFIALMQIMKEKGMPKEFTVSAVELNEKLKLKSNRYNAALKESLLRLSETNYNFKNTMYSSEQNGIIKEEISTPILTLRIITLSLKENQSYRDSISDKRIKEIYQINISDLFYKNIIQKGYMVYNGDTLLEIETSTARTIYMLIEKLRFDNLYLKLDTIFLIKRIPLKYNKSRLGKTVNTLENAFNELVNNNLISSFKFIKESTWEKSEIEIYFPEKANEEKQGRFYGDRNDLRKMLSDLTVSNTEHDLVEDIEIIEPIKNIKITKDVINKIINLMPSKAQELKTMPKAIKEAIEKYGYEKVEKTAIYMKKNKVEKVRAYFLKALENDWVGDDEIIPPKLDKISIKEPQFDFSINTPQYDESLYIEFEKLSIEVQNGMENYAYQEYVKQCGMNTKIQRIAFAGSRKKYICEFLEKHSEILGKAPAEKIQEEKIGISRYLTDLNEIKRIINRTLEMASMVNNYSEDEKTDLLKTIIKELMDLIQDEKLTIDILKEILKRYTGF